MSASASSSAVGKAAMFPKPPSVPPPVVSAKAKLGPKPPSAPPPANIVEAYAAAKGNESKAKSADTQGAKRRRDDAAQQADDNDDDDDDDDVSEKASVEEEPSDEVRYMVTVALVPRVDVDVQKMAKDVARFKDVDPSDGRPRPMIRKGSFLEVSDPTQLRAWENPPSMCLGERLDLGEQSQGA